MASKKLPRIRIFLAIDCLILSVVSFFTRKDLFPFIYTIAAVLLIVNGAEIAKNKKQPMQMSYFNIGVGIFLLITAFMDLFLG